MFPGDDMEFEMGTHHGFPTGVPLRKDNTEETADTVNKQETKGEEVFDVFKSDDELDTELDSENQKHDSKRAK